MIVDRLLTVHNWKRWAAVCALVLAMPAMMLSQTAVNRITQGVTAGGIVRLAGSVHPLTKKATDLGEVDSGMQLNSLTLNISLSAAQQNDLNTLLAAQQNPKSPLYHQGLTQEQYGARFGLSDADLSLVTEWLKSQGFTVREIAPSRNRITFSGTAVQAEAAFHTQIHRYELDGRTQIGNTTEVALPGALSQVVTSVGGLHGFRPKPRLQRPNPEFTSSVSGNHFLTPSDWATIYDVTPIYSAGYTGTNMHVGIAGQTYFPTTDISKFRSAAGLTGGGLNMVCISTSDCTNTAGESVGDIPEADLDVEWAGGIAQDATVDFVYAAADDPSQDVTSAMSYLITTYKVNGARVPVISVSYGACETDYPASDRAAIDSNLEQASAQLQTVLNSSGDSGATGCDSDENSIASGGLVVDYPASSQYITAVGGTTFAADGTAENPELYGNEYWSYSSTADIISSASQYIPETSWNDTAYSVPLGGGLSSSGGGVSQYEPIVTGQRAPSNFTGTAMRFVPDVAFAASPNHDGYLYCTQNFTSETNPADTTGSTCVDGFRISTDGDLSIIGGTSASSPSFAGLMTLLVQKYGMQGQIATKLYTLASNSTDYAAVFHDITTGTNEQPCTAGSSGCVGGYAGYAATTGYDMVTGLGSIDGYELYQALGGGTLLPGTTTAVTVSPTSALLGVGQTVTLTASVNSSAPGTISGTVAFMVGSTSLGTATITNGQAVLSPAVSVMTTNGFTAGTDAISAKYQGSSGFGASTGSTTLTVEGTTTTTTVTASPTAVNSGGVISLVATVSTGSPATSGTVTFTVGGASLGSASVTNGTATLNNVVVTTANGFAVGSNTVTASYSGTAMNDPSSGTTSVQMTATPTYTLAGSPTTVVMTKGSSTTVALNLTATNYTGTVTLVPSVTTSNGTQSAVTATLQTSSVSFASGTTGGTTLTITTTSSAANHAPARGWKTGGGVVVFAVLLGAPFTLRRKRALAVLLVGAAISLAGLMMACGGGSGSSSSSNNSSSSTSVRTYSVLVTPTGSGTVSNAAAITIMVTVQ